MTFEWPSLTYPTKKYFVPMVFDSLVGDYVLGNETPVDESIGDTGFTWGGYVATGPNGAAGPTEINLDVELVLTTDDDINRASISWRMDWSWSPTNPYPSGPERDAFDALVAAVDARMDPPSDPSAWNYLLDLDTGEGDVITGGATYTRSINLALPQEDVLCLFPDTLNYTEFPPPTVTFYARAGASGGAFNSNRVASRGVEGSMVNFHHYTTVDDDFINEDGDPVDPPQEWPQEEPPWDDPRPAPPAQPSRDPRNLATPERLVIPRKTFPIYDKGSFAREMESRGVDPELAAQVGEALEGRFEQWALDEEANYRAIEVWAERLRNTVEGLESP